MNEQGIRLDNEGKAARLGGARAAFLFGCVAEDQLDDACTSAG